jgi:predicted transcriptional regulator
VLPCSRVTSRAVGPLAWVVLEELALRAQASGEAAIATSVRALSSDLGVGKDTVAQALGRLVDRGLVRCQAQRRAGRYAGSAYELDLEACRHVGLLLAGVAANEMPLPAPPCPATPDAVERDAVERDAADSATAAAVRAEPKASASPPQRRVPEPGSQSLFDLSDEPSPSLTHQSNDLLRLTPLPSTASPSDPVPQHALPTAIPSSRTRSSQPDALAPEVRREGVNVARNGAGRRSSLNGSHDGEAGSPC